jgi:DNA-binding CsgD family transcriptional regulator
MQVLAGRCYDLTETPPYGPWIDLFARFLPSEGMPTLPLPFARPGTVGVVASQAMLFQQTRDFFVALVRLRPLIIMLDDLHWSDPASLDLLRFLARDLASTPILLLVTYRADELTRRAPLFALLPTLVREAPAIRLALRPLDAGDVRSLVTARYRLTEFDNERLVSYLHMRSDGNPFFIGELLHALETDTILDTTPGEERLGDLTHVGVPALLRQVIDGQVARLGPESQRLLTIAAVIGQEVPLALWRSVTDADEETLAMVVDAAVDARVLEAMPVSNDVRFVHALIREAVYEGAGPVRRGGWHRRVADALITQPDPDPDAIAYHLRQAGDVRAAAWLITAGERAERAYAWLSAAARFEAALNLARPDVIDAARRVRLLIRIAWYRRFADPQAGIASLGVAERLAIDAQNPTLAADAVITRGKIRCRTRDMRRGLQDLQAGITVIDALSAEGRLGSRAPAVADSPLNVDSERESLSLWLAHTGYYHDAAAVAERVTLPNAAHQQGHIHAAMGRPNDARSMFSLALEKSLNRLGVGQVAIDALQYVALPYFADDLGLRRSLAREGEEAWKLGSGALHPQDSPRLAQLPLFVHEGHWSEARELAHLVSTAPVADNRRLLAARASGQLARHQGDPALAWHLVLEWLPDGPATQPGDVLFLDALELQQVAAALALDADDPPTAWRWLETHDRWLAWNGARLGQAEGALGWARYYHIAGDAERANDLARQALILATDPRQPLALLAAHRLLGVLATDARRFTEGADHLALSLALADACAAPYERALTLFALAELRAATDERAEALDLLDAVRALCVPLGAKPLIISVDALAAHLTSMQHPQPAYPAGLSVREVEVLRLLAEGKTNRDIADALYLSAHTVRHHIAHILAKTNSDNRAAAAAFAQRHGLA